jgi:hypothetical protein
MMTARVRQVGDGMHRDAKRSDARAIVVVPRRPGTLIEPSHERAPGEVDALLDQLFGEAPTDRAGTFDVILVTSGAALIAATALAHLSGELGLVGVAMIALGLVLPVRDAARRLGGRRRSGRAAGPIRGGHPLDVTHASTRRLVELYRSLQSEAHAEDLGQEAVEAAHLALVEVAGLLQGRAPSGAEVDYVSARIDALDTLQAVLHTRAAARLHAHPENETQVRDATVTASRNLEDATGGTSVDRIEALRIVLERDAP